VTLTNGSAIIFGGLDDPLKMGSLELGWAAIDEAIETTEDDWQMLEGRLRLPNVPHQIIGATNPGRPAHYLHEMFFRGGRPGYEVYQASALDNPTLPKDYIERLESFTGVYYERNVLGRWVGMDGLVYSSFNEEVCVIPRFDIPKNWLIYTGHDFGSANPAAMFYAQDPDTGLFYAWREYLPGGGRERSLKRPREVLEARYWSVRSTGGSDQPS